MKVECEELGEYAGCEECMYAPEEVTWYIHVAFSPTCDRKYFKVYTGDLNHGKVWLDHKGLNVSRIDFTKPEYIEPSYHLTREEKIKLVEALKQPGETINDVNAYVSGIHLLRDLHLHGLCDYDGPDNYVDDLPDNYPMPDYMLLPED